jgi:hypothetical protein
VLLQLVFVAFAVFVLLLDVELVDAEFPASLQLLNSTTNTVSRTAANVRGKNLILAS